MAGKALKKFVLGVGCLFLFWTSACQCSPPITAQKIERDIKGKTVGIKGFSTERSDIWTFGADDEIEIRMVESTCRSNKARITINISTRSSAGIAMANASGSLHLYYEQVGDEWILREVQNESFKIDEIIIGAPS